MCSRQTVPVNMWPKINVASPAYFCNLARWVGWPNFTPLLFGITGQTYFVLFFFFLYEYLVQANKTNEIEWHCIEPLLQVV